MEKTSITELKSQLKSLGFSTTGVRTDLEERLYAAMSASSNGQPGSLYDDDDDDYITNSTDEAAETDFEGEAEGEVPGSAYSLGSWRHMLLAEQLPNVRVAVIAGGPSDEAAVSINSARTLMDMLQTVPYPEQSEQLATLMREVRCPVSPPSILSDIFSGNIDQNNSFFCNQNSFCQG